MQAARGASLNLSDQADHEPTRRRLDARLVFAAIAALAYAVDLGSKQWALASLADGDVPVLGDWLTLHLTFNPGAAFSTGTDFTIVFTCLAAIAVIVVLWLSRRIRSTGWAIALGLLLGGVAGNLTDRVVRQPEPLHGHVVDFLMLPNWPVFNVADSAISIGVTTVVVFLLFGIGEREDDAAPAGPASAAGREPVSS